MSPLASVAVVDPTGADFGSGALVVVVGIISRTIGIALLLDAGRRHLRNPGLFVFAL